MYIFFIILKLIPTSFNHWTQKTEQLDMTAYTVRHEYNSPLHKYIASVFKDLPINISLWYKNKKTIAKYSDHFQFIFKVNILSSELKYAS